MAKAKPKKPTREVPAKSDEPIDPKKVHELFGIVGPYDPPAPPIPTKGYVTWWDCGVSIQTLAKKHRTLFNLPDSLTEGFAKQTDSWRWRQINLTPIPPERPFADQEKELKTGDQPAHARELVTFLVLHFLATGERLDLGRLRCKDVLPSEQRMTVWFSPVGFDLASVSDEWKSPGIGLSVMSTPVVPRKK